MPLHRRLIATVFVMLVLTGKHWASPLEGKVADENLPLFELDDSPVYYSATGFAPVFKAPQPQFTYYDPPDLPKGELILALEFMDRYRVADVPGSVKWAAFLFVPVLDGRNRQHLKWLCLYFYNDQMYGYDPTAEFERDRRFAVSIRYEDRTNRELLFRFAEKYVQRVFPASIEPYYYRTIMNPRDNVPLTSVRVDYVEIREGRIGSIFPSSRSKKPRELVLLMNQYSAPNTDPGTDLVLGKPEGFGKWEFSWASFWEELTYSPDYLQIAAELVSPRWGQVVYFHYEQKLLFVVERPAKRKVLLFNIGQNLYAYHPRYGTWRTEALLADLENPSELAAKLAYPGIDVVERVEPVVAARVEQNKAPQG